MATTTTATTTTTGASMLVKHQVVDNLPKKFKQIKFGIQSNQDIVNQAVLEVSDRTMYDVGRGREPIQNGPLDKRLVSELYLIVNLPSKTSNTAICREPLARLASARHVACDYRIVLAILVMSDYRYLPSTSATSSSPSLSYRTYAKTARESC